MLRGGGVVKRKYKKAKTKITPDESAESEAPEADGERSIRDLTEEERNNIVELSKRGEMPAKIAKMFKLKPTAVSNFLYMQKLKS